MNERHGTTCCNCGGQLDLGQGYMGRNVKEYKAGQGIKAIAGPIFKQLSMAMGFGQ